MKNLLQKLVILAGALDEKQFYKEASLIDNLIKVSSYICPVCGANSLTNMRRYTHMFEKHKLDRYNADRALNPPPVVELKPEKPYVPPAPEEQSCYKCKFKVKGLPSEVKKLLLEHMRKEHLFQGDWNDYVNEAITSKLEKEATFYYVSCYSDGTRDENKNLKKCNFDVDGGNGVEGLAKAINLGKAHQVNNPTHLLRIIRTQPPPNSLLLITEAWFEPLIKTIKTASETGNLPKTLLEANIFSKSLIKNERMRSISFLRENIVKPIGNILSDFSEENIGNRKSEILNIIKIVKQEESAKFEFPKIKFDGTEVTDEIVFGYNRAREVRGRLQEFLERRVLNFFESAIEALEFNVFRIVKARLESILSFSIEEIEYLEEAIKKESIYS